MNPATVSVLAFCIGIIAGLRAFTAPATASVAAWLRWFSLQNSPLHFMSSGITALIFCVLALGEIANDKRPQTGNRTAPPSLIARIIFGALAGAALASGGGQSLIVGCVLGGVGAVVGTYGGFRGRMTLMKAIGPTPAALLEDAIAVVGGLVFSWLV